jgi:ABC-type multidrug transport system ATPase subunit
MLDLPAVVEVQNLVKRYGAYLAVRGVSFAIHAGEILGVLGPNGAGKSTIVKMITGLVDPTQGTVLFRGEPVARDPMAYKRAMGYVSEQPDLYGFLSGWEYLELAATPRGIDAQRSEPTFEKKIRRWQTTENDGPPHGGAEPRPWYSGGSWPAGFSCWSASVEISLDAARTSARATRIKATGASI